MRPFSPRRPLDGLPSIKWKLGAVIVAATAAAMVSSSSMTMTLATHGG